MKKALLSLSFVFIVLAAAAQTAIPNGDFENWISATYDYPLNYPYTSNPESFFKCSTPFSCVRTTDAYQGTSAIQLTTSISGNDTCFGYFINTNANGNPSSWTGGFPYTQTPTGISGFYKSAIPAGDSASILAFFRASNVLIGMYTFKFSGTQSTYTPFSFPLSPPLPMAPDSVIIAAISSDVFNNYAANGSMLQLDSVYFTGVASQPALMNGNFEVWGGVTLNNPINWYTSDSQGQGFARTIDVHSGNYAIELQTYLGNTSGNNVAQAGMISTGYWDNNCNCLMGGYPFSSQIDTLAFWYKYNPVNGDTAQVNLSFKNNGSVVSGANLNIYTAASTYQYAELPFNIGMTIDTVIVQIQSSSWSDTALAFIGSDLIVDDVHFKSQTVGINHLHASSGLAGFSYPNPVHDVLNIRVENNSSSQTRLLIYDVTGRIVREESFTSIANIHQLNVSDLHSGIYVCELRSAAANVRSRFLKQ
ncbi:MAG: T9SS type A sorting domain-containing protein [Bacteroidia bacterium]|nr:T9SS type A sorting domain-containing protein [Bacteroidia bacterium]